jgi:hypothetical protein
MIIQHDWISFNAFAQQPRDPHHASTQSMALFSQQDNMVELTISFQ